MWENLLDTNWDEEPFLYGPLIASERKKWLEGHSSFYYKKGKR